MSGEEFDRLAPGDVIRDISNTGIDYPIVEVRYNEYGQRTVVMSWAGSTYPCTYSRLRESWVTHAGVLAVFKTKVLPRPVCKGFKRIPGGKLQKRVAR